MMPGGKFGSPKTVPTRTVVAGIGMNPAQLGFRPIKTDDDVNYLQTQQHVIQQQQLLGVGPKPRASSAQDWGDPLGRMQPRAASAQAPGGPVVPAGGRRRDYFGPNEWGDPSMPGAALPMNGAVTARYVLQQYQFAYFFLVSSDRVKVFDYVCYGTELQPCQEW